MIFSVYNWFLNTLFPKACFACTKNNVTLCDSCIRSMRRNIDVQAPNVLSVFSYKDPLVKKMMHAIKYYHRKDLIPDLTRILAEEMTDKNYTGIFVPIPMPRIRKYVRGYNQAEHIATLLSEKYNLPIEKNLLIRLSSPMRQVEMKTRAKRLSNQKKTFTVKKDVHGFDIILVDDVTTTGATLTEATKTLFAAGAKSVKAVTLAH